MRLGSRFIMEGGRAGEEPTVPTYQYKCTECDEPLEAQQSFSEPSLTECPACGGHLRKVFNAVGVVFKGSGFYRNDSRNADAAASSGSSSTSETKSESTSGSKTESSTGSKSESSGGSSDSSSKPKSDTSKATTPA